MLTQEYLKEILNYNETTGEFKWIKKPCRTIILGPISGGISSKGYSRIRIKGKTYQAHRLAWFYIYGNFPKNNIDHINGNKIDNRIENLRDVTTRENGQNRVEHRNGRLLGASFHKRNQKWTSSIQINGQQKHLGSYNTELEAHTKYIEALKALGEIR